MTAVVPETPAQGIYVLLIGALAVAEKDESPGAAERRKLLALAADAYFPLSRLEKPRWICDAIEVRAQGR